MCIIKLQLLSFVFFLVTRERNYLKIFMGLCRWLDFKPENSRYLKATDLRGVLRDLSNIHARTVLQK